MEVWGREWEVEREVWDFERKTRTRLYEGKGEREEEGAKEGGGHGEWHGAC